MKTNISQFFVTRRPIAWTAMISILIWGVYAYLMMPQRQDPIIPVVTGVILTPYPGAEAEKVEQEVTRKIERKVAENPAVDHVKSISRPGMSIVYVELFETERHAELVWQDIRGKLGEIKDLPVAAGRPTQSILNKDFGDSVAVMLTISSPPVSDLEIELRAKNIREAVEAHRKQTPTTAPSEHWTGVLVYPSTVARSYVVRMGQTLAQSLSETAVAREVAIVEAPSAGMLDVTLNPGKTEADLQKAIAAWERQYVGADEFDPGSVGVPGEVSLVHCLSENGSCERGLQRFERELELLFPAFDFPLAGFDSNDPWLSEVVDGEPESVIEEGIHGFIERGQGQLGGMGSRNPGERTEGLQTDTWMLISD